MPRARAPQEEGARGSPRPLPKPALPIGSAGGERRGAEGRAPPVWERAGRAQGDALARLGRGEADMESGRPAGRPCWALGSAQLCKARPGQARPAAGRPREWGVVGDGEGSSHHLQAGPAWHPWVSRERGAPAWLSLPPCRRPPLAPHPTNTPKPAQPAPRCCVPPNSANRVETGGCPQNPKTRIRPCWHGGRTVCVWGGGGHGDGEEGCGVLPRGTRPAPPSPADRQLARRAAGGGQPGRGGPASPLQPGASLQGGSSPDRPPKATAHPLPGLRDSGFARGGGVKGKERHRERTRGEAGLGWGSGSRALGGRSLGAGGAASRCSPGEGPPRKPPG